MQFDWVDGKQCCIKNIDKQLKLRCDRIAIVYSAKRILKLSLESGAGL